MLQCLFVSAHPSGNCQLILGERSAILLDCTVAFCAPETVKIIKNHLGKRDLDAIILSHSHYDHATGLPWLREAFPKAPVYAHPYVGEIFSRPTALSLMHKMCQNARQLYGVGFSGEDFDDNGLKITAPLFDGQEIPFDDSFLKILFTAGHTKDSVSVDWPQQGITWLCETLGVPRPDGRVQPCFLSSCHAALNSVERVLALGERKFILSHTKEPLSSKQSAEYLAASKESITQSAELIMRLYNEGKDFDEIFSEYAENYWSESYRPIWPYEAFNINAKAAINAVLREFCGQTL